MLFMQRYLFFRFILLPFAIWADKDIEPFKTTGMARYTLFAFRIWSFRINLIINCLLRQGLLFRSKNLVFEHFEINIHLLLPEAPVI